MKAPLIRIIKRVSDRKKIHVLVAAVRQIESRRTALEGLADFDRRACTAYRLATGELKQAKTELNQLVKAGTIQVRPVFTRRWVTIGKEKIFIRKQTSNAMTLHHLGVSLRVTLWQMNGGNIRYARCCAIAEKLVVHYELLLKRRAI